MNIRKATLDDLQRISEIEALCFPAGEAAGASAFEGRLSVYPDRFWLLENEGKLIAFVNGPVTKESNLTDDMFKNPQIHDSNGKWQMILGVATLPAYQKQGHAGHILRQVIADVREEGRSGLVLTCKEKLVPYYAKFGFVNEGLSTSEHGGAKWYQMRLTL